MKILELTNFSAGICGVWNRVREESIRLSKKHEVMVFSSNITKGCSDIAPSEDKIGNIKIKRFPAKKLLGESGMSWDFYEEAVKFSPDVIIAHAYRHMHTLQALKIASELRKKGKSCKVFLVTHAPFERSSTRSLLQRIFVWAFDQTIGRLRINDYDKIITVSKWEIPHLLRIGAKKEKVVYIPNGIPEEFFKMKASKEHNKILYLGRVSPIKNLETVISAIPLLDDKNIILEIVGPAEKEYLFKLKEHIKSLNVEKRVVFSKPIYNVKEKIRKIDSAKIFVLPSKSEGMPQSLIEAMARSKIAIATNIPASRDLIKNRNNGFLFEVGDHEEFADIVNSLNKEKSLKNNARSSVKQFSWDKIIARLEKAILN